MAEARTRHNSRRFMVSLPSEGGGPSSWKLLFYDNSVRKPYHKNYCLSIIFWAPPKAAASGLCSRDSPSRTWVTFCTHKKLPKKRRETRTPLFVQSDGIRFDASLPLKYLFASGSLVTGAVGIPLRLTTLGLIGVSCRTKIDTSIPSKGRQPKPDKISAAD